MPKTNPKVVWTREARKSLKAILDYRYKDIPSARKILRSAIINSSKEIVFATQYQRDEVFSNYRKISVRDYKILYKEIKGVVYIMNVVCSLAN